MWIKLRPLPSLQRAPYNFLFCITIPINNKPDKSGKRFLFHVDIAAK